MSETASIINDDNIAFFHDGRMHHITKSNTNFNSIKAAILEKKYDEVAGLLNPFEMIEKKTNGLLKVIENSVFYKDDRLPECLVDRLLEIIQEGHSDLSSYLKFCENTYSNPSKNSREQMYNFIANRGMPITEDGCVLGYKGVSSDYKDRHSGTFSNRVGESNEMKRRDVDDDCNNHCSQGFHIGAKEYADSWAGGDGKLMLVKWDPANAVSVPSDHSYQKLRVCKYVVVAEVATEDRDQEIVLSGQIYSEDGTHEILGEAPEDFVQRHSDAWYKARNYIESCRDDGRETISNRELDDMFDISEWAPEEWEALKDETEVWGSEWTITL